MKRLALFLTALAFTGPAHAGTVTLTFSESPQNLPAGYSTQGVTLTWSNPNSLGDFIYGATLGTGGFGLTLLDDPVLQGATDGALAIHFAFPTTMFSFGFAVCCGQMTDGIGGTVTTAGGSQPIAGTLEPLGFISEGQFSYTGGAIGDATLTFPGAAGMFAVDNLTFEAPDSGAVPEPGSVALTAAGLLGGMVWMRKKGLSRYSRPR